MSNASTKQPALKKRQVAIIILVLLTVILLIGLFRFINHRLNYAITNAVFVASDSLTEIGFDRVGGVIIDLPVNEGDRIEKGQLLVRIDPGYYQLRVENLAAKTHAVIEKQAALKLKRQRLQYELKLQTKLTREEISRINKQQQAATAKVSGLKAQIDQLQRDQQRLSNLFAQQAIPRQKLEQIEAQLKSLQAEKLALTRNQQSFDPVKKSAQLKQQLSLSHQQQIFEIDRELASADATIEQLQAALNNARRDLDNTTLKSPINGRVAKKFINQGGNIAAGRPVLALVNPEDIYLLALLEENKLSGVEPGSKTIIHIDAYPDREWLGEVEQVLPASAATFALAPRDISAGEFTKVAQRIPVRIRITKGSFDKLRIGLGGEAEIRRQRD
ncbi:MAG: HlyD family secretion protein [Desulfuromusa sp.]|nr:HlyD family secretion protein [Desulfuromusa sp.]